LGSLVRGAKEQRIVKQETVGRFWISTVFIGIDYDFDSCKLVAEYGGGIPLDFYHPLVFETMVFGETEPPYMRRTRSWNEAEKAHARAVRWATHTENQLSRRENALKQIMEKGL
jgi:hypothetical protein